MGRAIRVDLPNGTFTRTEHSVWKSTAYDPNDTVDESRWALDRAALDPDTDPEGRALALTRAHANTPSRTYVDPLGRPFLSVAHNNDGGIDQYIATRTTLDIEGQPIAVTDPLRRVCQTHVFSIGGQLLDDTNIDKGTRRTLADVGGSLLRRIDDRGVKGTDRRGSRGGFCAAKLRGISRSSSLRASMPLWARDAGVLRADGVDGALKDAASA